MMNMDSNEMLYYFSQVVKLLKDKIYEDLCNKIEESYNQILQVEAQARREKVRSIIKNIQKLDIAILGLEYEYKRVREKIETDKIQAIDQYIKEIKQIRYSYVKDKVKI